MINEPELPQLRFGPEQVASFAPFVETVEAFGERHALRVSRLRDNDPVAPFVGYLFTDPRLEGDPKYAPVVWFGAREREGVCSSFFVSAGNGRKWKLNSAEGPERLTVYRSARSPERAIVIDPG